MRIIANLKQGSIEWHAHRATKWNASDAPAMLGESPHCTRAELLHRMATGIAPEVDAATQRRFDKGHAVEPLLIARACEIIGEPLHPFVAVADFNDRYSASFDGCTFVGDETAECKLLNARLRAAFADMETIAPEHRERSAGQCLPIDYRIQCEQQLRIAEAQRCLFLTGELREDGTLGDTLSCWYYPDDALWARIQAGWEQFAQDLASYVPPEPVRKIAAEPVEALPAVTVQVSGSLTLSDNFDAFERAMRTFLEHRLIREPKTDQDFADLDAQIKAMKGAEDALDSAEQQMLAQVASVDAAKRRKDTLKKLVRDNRLLAEKLMASEKERRRGELVAEGVNAVRTYVEGLNKRLGAALMPATVSAVDFGSVIKGMRSLDSMKDAIATRVAEAKIAANEVADRIDANLKTLAAVAPEHAALFPDRASIVLKAPEDLQVLVRARVAEHDAAVKRRAEEEARAAAKVRQEQEAREAEERRQAQPATPSVRTFTAIPEAGVMVTTTSPAVVPMPTRAPAAPAAPDEKPTLTLGEINTRLGITMTVAFVRKLGIEGSLGERGTIKFTESEFQLIAESLKAHITTAQHKALERQREAA